MADAIVREFTLAELSTIIAALRFYQERGMGDPANRSDDIHEIATCGDECVSLDADAIDELCEAINCGPGPEPEPARIIVVIEGGVVQHVACDRPARVLALDRDTEGCDDGDLVHIADGKMWASMYTTPAFDDWDDRAWADGLIGCMEKLNASPDN